MLKVVIKLSDQQEVLEAELLAASSMAIHMGSPLAMVAVHSSSRYGAPTTLEIPDPLALTFHP